MKTYRRLTPQSESSASAHGQAALVAACLLLWVSPPRIDAVELYKEARVGFLSTSLQVFQTCCQVQKLVLTAPALLLPA